MISKELLSEVLGVKVLSLYTHASAEHIGYCFDESCGNDISRQMEINIYELAHKCKEWAYNLNMPLMSGYYNDKKYSDKDDKNEYKIYCIVKMYEYSSRIWIGTIWHEIFNADTEPEAIFEACQWILENK